MPLRADKKYAAVRIQLAQSLRNSNSRVDMTGGSAAGE